ncbi:hypothetical protein BGX34_009988 [Mortierella sp. NVP85]|nr:hypothetical protein BGX34_009988 [Mortierella sp. NVP85]
MSKPSQQQQQPVSGPQRVKTVRPRKYIGHYDIADRTFQLLSRHRAAACILFWSLTILLDILLQLPIEWFFLFYFILALIFRIFFIGGHIVMISIAAMCISNAIVFYTVPFSFTSPFATGVAFGLMVSLIHGLNLKGVILAMTMYMLKPYIERQTLITALNPPSVPSIVILAPLASFCSAFGVLWLLYDLFGYLHASTDDLRDFFGITTPPPSIVTLKDVKDRSISLSWQCASQATISKHLIEIDGLIIGESGKQETSVVIQGLYPDNTYRIRLWAITTRNWKTPSDYVVVRTLASVPVELELSTGMFLQYSVTWALYYSPLIWNNTLDDTLDDTLHHTARLTTFPTTLYNNTIAMAEKVTEDLSLENNKDQPLENENLNSQEPKLDAMEEMSPLEDTSPSNNVAPIVSRVQPTIATTTATTATSTATPPLDTRTSNPNPASTVTEEQITALRIELETKEASHALLTQQFSDLEKHYKNQEELLRSEIATLREQQKQEDEPRQQAKAKLKELQESLREAEAHKSKMEKEHRIELDKRQRMTEQLEAKQKKLDSLRQTLRQNEEKLQTEKATYSSQILELEESLRKRSEEVKTAEASLIALQESQNVLCTTIESKELELQKLQATIHSPKGYLVWEQKVKDLDHKCAQLAKQLEQHTAENQRLQEQLTEATKNVAKVRSARETRKTQMDSWKSNRFPTTESPALSTDPQNQQQGQQQNHHPFQYQTQRGHTPARTKSGPLSAVGSNRTSIPDLDMKVFQNGVSAVGTNRASLNDLDMKPFQHGVSAVGANRTSLNDLDTKTFQNGVSGQSFNHYHYFGQPPSMNRSSDTLSETGSIVDPPLNEQSVIKSMFESPETLDFQHHLRTVGSHSSLGAQSKILPSHLRTASNPGTSPRLSPTVSTLLPFQSSPSWDWKSVARPGTLGRMQSQAESSSSSLNISNPSSPTSPNAISFSQMAPGFTRKTSLKDSGERSYWGGTYHAPDLRSRGNDTMYGAANLLPADYGLGGLTDESRRNSRWYPESHAHETLPPATADPWGQGEGRFKPSRLSTINQGSREALGTSAEGMLPSPTGSSTSSLDMGTPMSVDALVFADHYFSHRSHRGFDAPSALSSTALSTATIHKQPALDTNPSHAKMSKIPQAMAPQVMNPQVMSHTTAVSTGAGGESDILGYGLKLNPFGWSAPAPPEDHQDYRWNA